MDAKFTKGPWSQSHKKGPDSIYRTEVDNNIGETICCVYWHKVHDGNGVTSTDRAENAALIAAAPDMYAMLEMIMNILSGDDYNNEITTDDIRTLLTKARGG